MTSYQQIYDRFLNKVTSYKLLELSDQDIQEMLYHWLMSAIPKFRRCKTDLSLRDDDVLAFKSRSTGYRKRNSRSAYGE